MLQYIVPVRGFLQVGGCLLPYRIITIPFLRVILLYGFHFLFESVPSGSHPVHDSNPDFVQSAGELLYHMEPVHHSDRIGETDFHHLPVGQIHVETDRFDSESFLPGDQTHIVKK